MDLKTYSNPDQLERFSFIWSMIRLIIAAVALLLGGIPPVFFFIRAQSLFPVLQILLSVCWIISGLAAGYLAYRWFKNDKRLFGEKNLYDMIAFFVLIVSGINLGIAGLTRQNIGMSIFGSRFFFLIGAVIYLAAGVYILRRWRAHNQKLFS